MRTRSSNRRRGPSKSRTTFALLFSVLLTLWSTNARANDDWTRFPGRLYQKELYDKVGIGTKNPQDTMHLYRPWNSTVGILMGNAKSGAGRRGFLVDFHAVGGAELWNFENSDMWFGTNNSTKMTIKNHGAVGIGTNNPQDLLHLYRHSKSTVGVLMGNSLSGAGRAGFLIDYHKNGGAELWNFENTDMAFGTNNQWRMTLTRDGRLGIGTYPHDLNIPKIDNRDLKLDVQGMVRISQVRVWNGPGKYDLTWARGCHQNGSGTVCGGFQNSRVITREGSSERYKKNIEPLKKGEAASILSVETKRYEMREGYGPEGWTTIGLIAEELDEAGLSDIVIYNEEGMPDGVDYKKVALYTNEVVKEQQKVIQQLQKDMAMLKDALGLRAER